MSSLPSHLPPSRTAPPGQPRDRPEAARLREGAEHPLSHGQEALWYLDRLAAGSPAYVIAGAALFPGGLDATAFRRAWEALVERHPALRTTYGEGPVQRIHPGLSGDWFEEIDAGAWSAAEMRERLAAEAARPFDLERGPVLRVRLLRRGGPTPRSGSCGAPPARRGSATGSSGASTWPAPRSIWTSLPTGPAPPSRACMAPPARCCWPPPRRRRWRPSPRPRAARSSPSCSPPGAPCSAG